MTQTMVLAEDKQPSTSAGLSPKPKPAVASASPNAPAGQSPKPKPAVASRHSGNFPGGVPRLAPFEKYSRIDPARGSGPKEELAEVGGMRSKPVAKKRLINIFPGGATKR